MTEMIRVHGYDVVLDKTKCHAIKKSDGFHVLETKSTAVITAETQGDDRMRAVVYGRVSTDLQSETSVNEQLRRTKQYVEMKGGTQSMSSLM